MAKSAGYKRRLLEEIKTLSEGRVKALADYAAYLGEREEWEATAEVLGNPVMARQIRKSRKAWAEGRKADFLSLAEIKAKLSV